MKKKPSTASKVKTVVTPGDESDQKGAVGRFWGMLAIFCVLIWLLATRQLFYIYIYMKGKVAQLCPTLCDPMDYTVHGILSARILEWVAFPFSRESSQPRE